MNNNVMGQNLKALIEAQEDPTPLEDNQRVSSIEKNTQSLCEDLTLSNFDADAWLRKITEFAEAPENRLIYSAISNVIFSLDNHQRITRNIKTAANVVLNPDGDWPGHVKKMVVKIYDHINLAIRQKALFQQNEKDVKDQIETILSPKLSQKSEELTKEMTAQLVALVAIFTALSFILFGGISSLDSIFASLKATIKNKNSILPTLIVALAWAFCLMNLLFGFMYFIFRIAKIEPPGNIKGNMVQRYPVIFLCNYVIFSFLAIFSAMWFAECYGIGSGLLECVVAEERSNWTFVIGGAAILLTLGGLGKGLWKRFKEK